MPRLRTIKPGFFRNETLAELPHQTRLLFAGLWCWCDREGRMEDRPKRIAADIFPYDAVTEKNLDEMLNALASSKFILRYANNGQRYLQVLTWDKHQQPHKKEAKSVIPPYKDGESTMLAPCNTGPSTPVFGLLSSVLNAKAPEKTQASRTGMKKASDIVPFILGEADAQRP